ncbi:YfhO family protein [Carnobacterium inhibens]|uniref:YfhO family protein n=1 Tax=Carnobacterium inhibens TaxID=147709 RepID=A0ABR7TEU8_9LACT|nr:YfhO family protein [Carnobacterium inhibens]MBC9825896.1 YfhO family protein [Carnobacterium inhibens]
MDKKHFFKNYLSKYVIILLFFAVISIVSIYFSHIYEQRIITGDDIQFHKNRIEGLYQALSNGDLFPRLNMTFLNSMGYASSIFYSDIFIYIPAIFRLIGFSITESYVAFLIIINFATFIIAYHSMFNVTKKNYNSLLFSVIYTLSTYRLLDMTTRAALGELLAFAFLPLAFLGVYHIFYGEQKKWYFLSLGMSLIIFSHLLSAVMFALFIFLFMILNFKKLLQNRVRLTSLVKAVLTTLPLVSLYFIPVLEQLASQTFKVGAAPIFFMSDKASNLGNMFLNALSNKSTPNIGIILLLFLFLYSLFFKKVTTKSTKDLFLISIFFLLLSTDLFPWKLLDGTFLNTFQFPWRFLTLVTLGLSWIISLDSLKLLMNKKLGLSIIAFSVLLSISFATNSRQDANEEDIVSFKQFNEISSFNIGVGLEYLPEATNYENLKTRNLDLSYNPDAVTIVNYVKKEDSVTFEYNTTDKELITLPLIFYKGYVSENSGSGAASAPFLNKKEDGLTAITVNGKGKVTVHYKDTLLQSISLYASLISWVIFTIYLLSLFYRNIHSYFIK